MQRSALVRLAGRKIGVLLVGCGIIGLLVPPAQAADLKPETVAAFDRYIRATEARMDEDLREGRFLVVDRLPSEQRREVYASLRQGQVFVEQMYSLEDGHAIRVPSGMIHDWTGVIFIPGATIPQVLAVLRDYDNHKNIYKPDVRRSQLLEHSGNQFEVYLQLYRKTIVTVVVNVNCDVKYTQLDSTHSMSRSYSTRIAEVQNAGEPDERELPVGRDHGYLWRLYSYWRMEEKDGGVYLQNESVALSRSVPWIFAWLVNPLIRSIPRAVLSGLLQDTRKAVLKENPLPADSSSP
jgi:hypothetical protein